LDNSSQKKLELHATFLKIRHLLGKIAYKR